MSRFDGVRLCAARKRRRLSRHQLGSAVGVDGRRVAQWELGKRVPSPATVAVLADLLMISPDALLVQHHRHPAGRAAATEAAQQRLRSPRGGR